MIDTTDRCMNSYQTLIEEFPVLTREQEREILDIINKYKGGKAKREAKELLFNSNVRLVMKEASRYKSLLPLADLMNAGCEGLWIATNRFNPKFKHKFSTYAVPWIRVKIFRLLSVLGTMVYIPANVQSKSYKYKNLMEKDANLTDKQLMEELQVNKKGLYKIKMAQHSTLSLNYTYSDKDKESESALEDFLPDDKALNPRISAEIQDTKHIIHDALEELEPVQKDILIERYLSGEKTNLSTLGKKWNISGERVRQIEFQAFKKLRKKLKNKTTFGRE
jgi:RNA polymerase primary sigma factor